MPQIPYKHDDTDRSSDGWGERLTASMAEARVHSEQLAGVDKENVKLRERLAALETALGEAS